MPVQFGDGLEVTPYNDFARLTEHLNENRDSDHSEYQACLCTNIGLFILELCRVGVSPLPRNINVPSMLERLSWFNDTTWPKGCEAGLRRLPDGCGQLLSANSGKAFLRLLKPFVWTA